MTCKSQTKKFHNNYAKIFLNVYNMQPERNMNTNTEFSISHMAGYSSIKIKCCERERISCKSDKREAHKHHQAPHCNTHA